ncbi:asparagine synthase (glutamine-hydrolyzing) [Aetokthonos hydrillicola Thurmond2011]|jgi:asparagine synthase (glutamine-hydrolysing)|uniref:asparagine synthase (glutamine-hydrolyzing) n=1 Tax=Aetokthonos hydrillicola Thurmond2011 TaxID=2712845 RepID=A0AAP5M6I7_9CYAN|nr:asparagine synthase (glutamine-hydrolyzing) [Aetokthonos hydrillicola]MBO3458644.1 asparagine synthase (glutamine-hydrolyzing) [Aetokthonos hydrillicola CCALA 1050]MBW4587997.1 asparagine synthase (glutamine-hydrolyzing) [Aetokthonos hydrillicola CCALA 1050]MDR9897051.1 asparagine synthase (glutamine-hydrolyzing) [Aetokthonos hydrillicola Thurmond2011]
MCGLAGFLNLEENKHQKNERLNILKRMSTQLSLRGPDDEQLFDSERLSLVFRRLSIIDVLGGQQPIWNSEQTMFVAVNGEIYNYKELRSKLESKYYFSSHSDAEVVLHLYTEGGLDALNQLNGMYAIAIWDARKSELCLVRDRLGIKPLYYCQVGSQLVFGSTLASLLVHPDVTNIPQWQDLTNLSAFSSYVKGIKRLPGGYYLTVNTEENVIRQDCYWKLSNYFVNSSVDDCRSPQDYVDEYRSLFADSVKKQLMSDVPVGAFLSGGLDSSAIVAAASKHTKDLHCFTVVSDYSISVGDAKAAQSLCEHLNLPFHPVWFDPERILEVMNFSLEKFEYFIWLIDSPNFEIEWVLKHELHRYVKTLIPELKVILLGQGSDEFAGGYSTPEDLPQSNWNAFSSNMMKMEQEVNSSKQQTNLKDGSYLFDILGNESISFPEECTFFQREMLRRVLTLQRYNLWHEDRSSSGQGIESRVPFLDHRLVEYLAAIPPSMQEILFWDKKIIREMSREWLPDDLAYRKKSYAADPASWMKTKHKILVNIFDDFYNKYQHLKSFQNFPLSSKIAKWFKEANTEDAQGIHTINKLLNTIAMIVFNNLCLNREIGIDISKFKGQSPLEEIHNF